MKNLIVYFLLFLAVMAGCKSKHKQAGILNIGHNEETRKAIQSVISDPQRSATMAAVVDSFDTEAQAIATEVKEKQEQIKLGIADYDTPRAQLQQRYDEIGVKLEQLCQSAKKHSLELRGHCSEAEWKKIVSHHRKPGKINYF